MRTNTKANTFHITQFVLFFFAIFLLQSCAATPTSVRFLESSEFEMNLPGLWEGNWRWSGRSGKRHINIIKIDGNKVVLTGYTSGGDYWAETEDVNGHIYKSHLLLTWPSAGPNGVTDRYKMIKDDSDSLILDGIWQSPNSSSGTSRPKKVK